MRVAVAFLFEGEAAESLNGLRRRYDPKSAERVDAHVTIAGPMLWSGTVDSAAEHLQDLLRREPPFELVVDGVGTFLPASPTCFATVEPRDRLTALHDLVAGQLVTKDRWPFIPHATIGEFLSPEETARVAAELRPTPPYFVCPVDHLNLLKQVKGGRWEAFYALPLTGPPVP